MTKSFNVVVRYKDGRISEPVIVNSIEAIVKNLRIMAEGDTFQITRLVYKSQRIRPAQIKTERKKRHNLRK